MAPPAHPLRTADQLGLILRSARKAKKLTQGDLASKLNVSQSRVSQLELQPGDLTVHQLMDWCAALSLEVKIGERAMPATTHATPPTPTPTKPAPLKNKNTVVPSPPKTPRKGSW